MRLITERRFQKLSTEQLLDLTHRTLARLKAEAQARLDRDELLRLLTAIDDDSSLTIVKAAKLLERPPEIVAAEVKILARMNVLAEPDWEDRLPDEPDQIYGFDDGGIYYSSEDVDGEIRVQDHPDLYMSVLRTCRKYFSRTKAASPHEDSTKEAT
jgi:hypothetical protein